MSHNSPLKLPFFSTFKFSGPAFPAKVLLPVVFQQNVPKKIFSSKILIQRWHHFSGRGAFCPTNNMSRGKNRGPEFAPSFRDRFRSSRGTTLLLLMRPLALHILACWLPLPFTLLFPLHFLLVFYSCSPLLRPPLLSFALLRSSSWSHSHVFLPSADSRGHSSGCSGRQGVALLFRIFGVSSFRNLQLTLPFPDSFLRPDSGLLMCAFCRFGKETSPKKWPHFAFRFSNKKTGFR